MTKLISEIEKISNFENFPNQARASIINKFNELIQVVNRQQKEIEALKQQVSNVDDRTFQFQKIGGVI